MNYYVIYIMKSFFFVDIDYIP